MTGELSEATQPVKTLTVRVVEIKGHCPVYQPGDRFRVREGYVLEAIQGYCMHALSALMPYYAALSRGIEPLHLGLCRPGGEAAYLQCPDRTVLFEVTPAG